MAGYTQADIPNIQANLQKMNLSDPATAAYLDDYNAGRVSSLDSGANNLQKPTAPTTDPSYQALLDKQKGLADDFRKNLPQTSQTLGNQYEQASRKNLAKNLKATDQDYNRRGLLYSGNRVGNQAKQQTDNAADIASGKQQINRGLLDKADAMDAGVFTTGMGIAGGDTGSYQFSAATDIMNLKNQIAESQREAQAMGSLASGLGSVFGAGLASTQKKAYPGPLDNYYTYGASPDQRIPGLT